MPLQHHALRAVKIAGASLQSSLVDIINEGAGEGE
jgi:hypothetical protein